MRKKLVLLAAVALSVTLLYGQQQDQVSITVEDLKLMIVDRDIEIRALNKQVQAIQLQYAECQKKGKDDAKKADPTTTK